jgi:hypothetical protein
MKKLVLIVVAAIGVAIVPTIFAHHSCDEKLDALSHTVLTTVASAESVNSEMTSFTDSCCDRVRGESRAPSCSCSTTAITAAGTLPTAGAYCLANDITGDIDAPGLQVKINLNGHKVTGSVTIGERSYLYGGTITDTLTVGSFSHIEQVTIANLVGSNSVGVLVNDVFFSEASTTMPGFDSITFCNTLFNGDIEFQTTKDIILRHSQIRGNFLYNTDQLLERVFFYDSSVQGSCTIATVANMLSFGAWNSSFQNFNLAMNLVSAPYPVVTAHGSTFKRFALTNSGAATGMVGLIDECTCEQLVLTKAANLRCQNTVVNALSTGAAVVATDCEQVTFDHVQAYSEVDVGFGVYNGKNILLKQCSAVSTSGAVAAFDFTDSAVTNLNLFECVAKNSSPGFYFGSGAMTGTVIRCVADNCSTGFYAELSDMKVVFSGNTSLCYEPSLGNPFNRTDAVVTAVSWRNIGISCGA